jgi:hypothetical protein
VKTKLCILILVSAIFLGALLTGCDRSPKPNKPETKWIDPSKLELGPIQHDALTDDQMERVKFLQKTFNDVDPSPLDKWVEDFKRDANPEPELKIWESMAATFNAFVTNKQLNLEAKKEVYQVVLFRSGAPDEEVLKHLKVKILSEEDVKEILALYKDKPEPIQVIKQ